jgi:tetratricopeptide (TPR) repeat protein
LSGASVGLVSPEELIRSGYQARREGRLAEAREIFSQAVELCRRNTDQHSLASSLVGLGQIERDLKNAQAALQCYREAIEIYRRDARPLTLAHTIRHLADILRGEGDLASARPLYEEALSIYRNDPETRPLDLANAIRGFALLRGIAAETEDAKALWQEARALYVSLNVQAGVQESDGQISLLTKSCT